MRNLYRPICLMALLAVAPTVLIGCSGGSSSNNSTLTTTSNLTFSTAENANFLRPNRVQGVFVPKAPDVESGPNYSQGSGIFSYYDPASNQPEGTGALVNTVVVNNSAEQRLLFIDRATSTGAQEAIGTTYNIGTQTPAIGIRLTRTYITNSAPFGASYLATGGTVTVTAINGNYVTLNLANVTLVAQTVGADPATLQLNGTVTYSRSNVKTLDFGSNNQTGTTKKN